MARRLRRTRGGFRRCAHYRLRPGDGGRGPSTLLALDRANGYLQTLALRGNRFDVGNVLLSKSRFERLAGGLVDSGPDLRIGTLGSLQRVSDGRF
jgi:hypothetical protein